MALIIAQEFVLRREEESTSVITKEICAVRKGGKGDLRSTEYLLSAEY
jgi:hypothetical protein